MGRKDKAPMPEGEKCSVCPEPATEYCPYCMDEYDTAPRFVPTTFYCAKHYESVVENGHCCYGSEQIYGKFQS